MKEIDANATKQEKYDEFTFDNESMQPSVTENQSGGTYSFSFGADANGMKAQFTLQDAQEVADETSDKPEGEGSLKTITLDEIMEDEAAENLDEVAATTKQDDEDEHYHEIFVNEIRRKEQLE